MKSLLCTALLMMAVTSYVASQTYVVEVYFVVEPQVVRNYIQFGYDEATAINTINSDVDYTVYQINNFFRSLDQSGVSMEIRAKKVEVMPQTASMFADCILIRERDLQSDMAMETFKEWLKTTDAHNTVGYDMAVVWTGYDLFSSAGNNQVAGYATVGATCSQPHGVAIAEFDGTMAAAITTAHEIAHSLGAPHEEYKPGNPCSSENGFIMNPTSSTTNAQRWSFSSCTATAIQTYINKLVTEGNNCLTDTSTTASTFDMASMANADILDPAKICQRSRNDVNSYFCHYDSFYAVAKGDEVCTKLMCGAKETLSCGSVVPSDGMICDTNKRCDKGRCVTATIPTGAVDTDCVFGDIQSDFIESVSGQTCEQFVGERKDRCYTSWIRTERCCKTCGLAKLDIVGCEYGDKNTVCKNYQPAQICGSASNAEICCETCHGYVGKRSVRDRRTVQVNISDKPKDQSPPPSPTNDDDSKKEATVPPQTSD